MHTNSVAFYLQSCYCSGTFRLWTTNLFKKRKFRAYFVCSQTDSRQQNAIPTNYHRAWARGCLGRPSDWTESIQRVRMVKREKPWGRGWIVYSVANYRPHLSHFWANMYFSRSQLSHFLFLWIDPFFRLNEEHFTFHLQYKHFGTFAN